MQAPHAEEDDHASPLDALDPHEPLAKQSGSEQALAQLPPKRHQLPVTFERVEQLNHLPLEQQGSRVAGQQGSGAAGAAQPPATRAAGQQGSRGSSTTCHSSAEPSLALTHAHTATAVGSAATGAIASIGPRARGGRAHLILADALDKRDVHRATDQQRDEAEAEAAIARALQRGSERTRVSYPA